MTDTRAKEAHVWARDDLDWYVEPEQATIQLLRVEKFTGDVIDPCCGRGNIVRTLLSAGYGASGFDIMDRTCDAPWFIGVSDFLTVDDIRQPNIVMNPPFFRAKGTETFIRHALKVAAGKVCVFADLKFLTGSGRAKSLYRDHPPHRVWMITRRPSCPPGEYLEAGHKAGGGTADWVWMVWSKTEPYTGTSLGWLTDRADAGASSHTAPAPFVGQETTHHARRRKIDTSLA